ncbi:Rha family transcriptional regulator [Alkalibacillus salilacus]|uniref:Rha family phage regulatory protein n=1 Tax=Alkalibacillus salilacus TaxID=284582 RepID=A0ABT9VD35_9BACI|nr:Rha family transcriptional regulator [Alkalibacillus salilacus]MDQ0158849.1 Rha family phage regulatory protein [Alkalibacillus salilacus]
MNDLVFVQDQQVVTDSLTVAETFGKRHDRVMQDVRTLNCSNEFSLHHFVESAYTNERGREYPKIIMTEQGFTLLVMSYTGKEAMRFKEQYIKAFHDMREKLNNNVHVLDERQSIIQSMKLTVETAEKQEATEQKVALLERKVDEQITLDYGEQRRFQKGVAKRVYNFTSDQDEASRLFRELYRDVKDRFGVASYKDVKRKDLQQALNYIEHWLPRQVS